MKCLFPLLFLLFVITLKAQVPDDVLQAEETAHKNYEQLVASEGLNADSAMAYVYKLARQSFFSRELLMDYIQGRFAYEFAQVSNDMQRGRIRREILKKMATDHDPVLAGMARPLALWVAAMDSSDHIEKLSAIAEKFLHDEWSNKDIYTYHTGRYALLIYKILVQKKELDAMAAVFFKKISARLAPYLSNAGYFDSTDAVRKSCTLKYLYASGQFIRAGHYLDKKDKGNASGCLRQAFIYSPDNTGLSLAGNFGYDMLLLFGEEKSSFRQDYLDFLMSNNGSREEILSCMGTMALMNPSLKARLKDYYTTRSGRKDPFDQYWLEFLNKNLKKAPGFILKQLNGQSFSTALNKNKWILLDFWGTWCGPCRRELPDIDKFYRQEVLADTGRLALLTIACRDKETQVRAFMEKNNYVFPVAMSNGKVEKEVPIAGFPTKILITPQGRYQVIPFGQRWQDFIRNFAQPD